MSLSQKAKAGVVILGAGGHAREIFSYLKDCSIPCLGAFDDVKKGILPGGLQILGSLADLPNFAKSVSGSFFYLSAVGDNQTRKKIADLVNAFKIPTLSPLFLRHPTAYVGQQNQVGHDVLMAPGTFLTTGVTVGNHVIINVKASLSHDVVVGNYCNINPGVQVAGNVTILEGASIGAGATIREKIRIGKWAVVGAGAVVVKDVQDYSTVVGVPAKPLLRSAKEAA